MPSLRSLYTRARNTIRGPLDRKIIFVHIPKCGGTSFNDLLCMNYPTLNLRDDKSLITINPRAIYKAYKLIHGKKNPDPFEDDYIEVLKLEEKFLLYHLYQENTRYVVGHFAFSDIAYEEFHARYSFVTLLRNPVDRMISHYFYNRYKNGDLGKTDKDISSYLKSARSRNQGHEYVKKLHGTICHSIDYTSEDAINQAKDNLKKFAVVGCLEFPENILAQVRTKFGIIGSLPKKNISPKSKKFQNEILNDEIKEQFHDICKPDLDLYNYALDIFVKERPE
jgi:hypothetical protein